MNSAVFLHRSLLSEGHELALEVLETLAAVLRDTKEGWSCAQAAHTPEAGIPVAPAPRYFGERSFAAIVLLPGYPDVAYGTETFRALSGETVYQSRDGDGQSLYMQLSTGSPELSRTSDGRWVSRRPIPLDVVFGPMIATRLPLADFLSVRNMTCSDLIKIAPDPDFIFGSIQSCSWPVSEELEIRDYVTVLEIGLGDLSWGDYYAKDGAQLHVEIEAAREIVVPSVAEIWARLFDFAPAN